MRRFWLTLAALMSLWLLAACGGSAAPAPAPVATTVNSGGEAEPAPTTAAEPTAEPDEADATGDVSLVNATFAKALGEDQEPIDPTESFEPDETIYFSMEFDGRPETGLVAATFMLNEQEIATAEADFADANSGVIFSLGQSTYVGFNLSHEEPLPISEGYSVEVTLDGEPLDSYPFAVVPPAEAIETQVGEVTLAAGADEDYNPVDERSEFAPEEEVFLVGNGDFGISTWLQADWYVNGELAEEGTRSLTLEENAEATGFAFNFRPEGGWPVGEHEAVLTVNDEEIGRYPITITEDAASGETGSDTTGGDTAAVELTTFAHPSGVYSIDVPSDWEADDSSSGDGIISTYWTSPNGDGSAIFVTITESGAEVTADELAIQATDFVSSTFGMEPDFRMLEAVPQGDGSVLVGWAAAPDYGNGPQPLLGSTYLEQRGDKFSVLTIILPQEEYETLWEQTFSGVANSYKIDTEAALP